MVNKILFYSKFMTAVFANHPNHQKQAL